MARKLKALNISQKEVIDTIAHIAVVSELSANVEGMSSFKKFYIENTLTPKQSQIYKALQRRCTEVKKDMSKMMKESNAS